MLPFCFSACRSFSLLSFGWLAIFRNLFAVPGVAISASFRGIRPSYISAVLYLRLCDFLAHLWTEASNKRSICEQPLGWRTYQHCVVLGCARACMAWYVILSYFVFVIYGTFCCSAFDWLNVISCNSLSKIKIEDGTFTWQRDIALLLL